ncbi:hypothetical protein Plhal304r1_c019g0066921 [Plasmopara halstedii]
MTYTPEQYLANKARIMETQKRYYQRTCEARLGYQKEYDDKNRDQIRTRKRKPKTELSPSETESNTENELN